MTALLQINSVAKDFSGLEVLLGINLTVEDGERHAIIGPNGAGKSTLFNVITGRHRVSDGQILFKDRDITNWPPHRLSRIGLARSFQVTNIFPNMTVYENIRNVIVSKKKMRFNIFKILGSIEDVNSETRGVLETIGLATHSDTPAGELAYGHQRALEIGLALAMDPELILLDEPTAGMTTEETRDAVKLIERITAGKTLVIIEHDMNVVFSISDRISVLYYGKILATGAAEEIRENQEVKKAYLGSKK